jgi:hypothetical protein
MYSPFLLTLFSDLLFFLLCLFRHQKHYQEKQKAVTVVGDYIREKKTLQESEKEDDDDARRRGLDKKKQLNSRPEDIIVGRELVVHGSRLLSQCGSYKRPSFSSPILHQKSSNSTEKRNMIQYTSSVRLDRHLTQVSPRNGLREEMPSGIRKDYPVISDSSSPVEGQTVNFSRLTSSSGVNTVVRQDTLNSSSSFQGNTIIGIPPFSSHFSSSPSLVLGNQRLDQQEREDEDANQTTSSKQGTLQSSNCKSSEFSFLPPSIPPSCLSSNVASGFPVSSSLRVSKEEESRLRRLTCDSSDRQSLSQVSRKGQSMPRSRKRFPAPAIPSTTGIHSHPSDITGHRQTALSSMEVKANERSSFSSSVTTTSCLNLRDHSGQKRAQSFLSHSSPSKERVYSQNHDDHHFDNGKRRPKSNETIKCVSKTFNCDGDHERHCQPNIALQEDQHGKEDHHQEHVKTYPLGQQHPLHHHHSLCHEIPLNQDFEEAPPSHAFIREQNKHHHNRVKKHSSSKTSLSSPQSVSPSLITNGIEYSYNCSPECSCYSSNNLKPTPSLSSAGYKKCFGHKTNNQENNGGKVLCQDAHENLHYDCEVEFADQVSDCCIDSTHFNMNNGKRESRRNSRNDEKGDTRRLKMRDQESLPQSSCSAVKSMHEIDHYYITSESDNQDYNEPRQNGSINENKRLRVRSDRKHSLRESEAQFIRLQHRFAQQRQQHYHYHRLKGGLNSGRICSKSTSNLLLNEGIIKDCGSDTCLRSGHHHRYSLSDQTTRRRQDSMRHQVLKESSFHNQFHIRRTESCLLNSTRHHPCLSSSSNNNNPSGLERKASLMASSASNMEVLSTGAFAKKKRMAPAPPPKASSSTTMPTFSPASRDHQLREELCHLDNRSNSNVTRNASYKETFSGGGRHHRCHLHPGQEEQLDKHSQLEEFDYDEEDDEEDDASSSGFSSRVSSCAFTSYHSLPSLLTGVNSSSSNASSMERPQEMHLQKGEQRNPTKINNRACQRRYHPLNKMKDRHQSCPSDRHSQLRCNHHPPLKESVICEDSDDDNRQGSGGDIMSVRSSPNDLTVKPQVQSVVSSNITTPSLLSAAENSGTKNETLMSRDRFLKNEASRKITTKSFEDVNHKNVKKRKAPAPPSMSKNVTSPPPPPVPSTEPPFERETVSHVNLNNRTDEMKRKTGASFLSSCLKDKDGVVDEHQSREESKEPSFTKTTMEKTDEQNKNKKETTPEEQDNNNLRHENQRSQHRATGNNEAEKSLKSIESRKQTRKVLEDNEKLVLSQESSWKERDGFGGTTEDEQQWNHPVSSTKGKVFDPPSKHNEAVFDSESQRNVRSISVSTSSEGEVSFKLINSKEHQPQRKTASSSSHDQHVVLSPDEKAMKSMNKQETTQPSSSQKVVDKNVIDSSIEKMEKKQEILSAQTGSLQLQPNLSKEKEIVKKVSQSEVMENHTGSHERKTTLPSSAGDEGSKEGATDDDSMSRSRSFTSSSCPVSICQDSLDKTLERMGEKDGNDDETEDVSIRFTRSGKSVQEDGDLNARKQLSSTDSVGEKGVKIVGNVYKNPLTEVNTFPAETLTENDGERMTTTSSRHHSLQHHFGRSRADIVDESRSPSGTSDIFETKASTVFFDSSSSASSSSPSIDGSPSVGRKKLPSSTTWAPLTDTSSKLQSSSHLLSNLDHKSPNQEANHDTNHSCGDEKEQSKQQREQLSPSMTVSPQSVMKESKGLQESHSRHHLHHRSLMNEIQAVKTCSRGVEERNQSLNFDSAKSGIVTKEFGLEDTDSRTNMLVIEGKDKIVKHENPIFYQQKLQKNGNQDEKGDSDQKKKESQRDMQSKNTGDQVTRVNSLKNSVVDNHRNNLLGRNSEYASESREARNSSICFPKSTTRMTIDPVTSTSFNAKSVQQTERILSGQITASNVSKVPSKLFRSSSSSFEHPTTVFTSKSNEYHPPLPPKPSTVLNVSPALSSSSAYSSGCSPTSSSPDQQKESRSSVTTTLLENGRKEENQHLPLERKKVLMSSSIEGSTPRKTRPLPNFFIGSYYDNHGSKDRDIVSPYEDRSPPSLVNTSSNRGQSNNTSENQQVKKSHSLQSSQSFAGVKSYPLPKSLTLSRKPISNFQVTSASPTPPWDDEIHLPLDSSKRLSFQENRNKVDLVLRQKSNGQREIITKHVSLLQINSCPEMGSDLSRNQNNGNEEDEVNSKVSCKKVSTASSSGSSSFLSCSPSSSSYSTSPPLPLQTTESFSSTSSGEDEGVASLSKTHNHGNHHHAIKAGGINCTPTDFNHFISSNNNRVNQEKHHESLLFTKQDQNLRRKKSQETGDESVINEIVDNKKKAASMMTGVTITVRGKGNNNINDNNKETKSNDSSLLSSSFSSSPDIMQGKEEQHHLPPSSIHEKEIMTSYSSIEKSSTSRVLLSSSINGKNNILSRLKTSQDPMNTWKGKLTTSTSSLLTHRESSNNRSVSRERRRQQDPSVGPPPPPPMPPSVVSWSSPPQSPVPSHSCSPSSCSTGSPSLHKSSISHNNSSNKGSNDDGNIRSRLLEEIRGFRKKNSDQEWSTAC